MALQFKDGTFLAICFIPVWPLIFCNSFHCSSFQHHIDTLDKKDILPFFLFPLNQANYRFWNKPHYKQTLFYCILLYCTSKILHFSQIVGLWQPFVKQISGCCFSKSIYSLHISMSYFGNSWNISNSSTSNKIRRHWRLRWWLAIFSNEVFLN